MSEPIIDVQRVTKQVADSTGTLTILHEISFALRPRESVAIVGASGSGKSTLLSIVAGLDVPSSGTVVLAGVDLFQLGEDARAAVRATQVGFVFQSFQLLGNLTALENVMLPLELMGRADARATATEMLRRVGLGERLKHYPKVLSGGEQQRVALARAFVVRPAVLLADEPTGSLDFATGATVMELMFEMNREAGTTLVLVTHDREIASAASGSCASKPDGWWRPHQWPERGVWAFRQAMPIEGSVPQAAAQRGAQPRSRARMVGSASSAACRPSATRISTPSTKVLMTTAR